MKRKWLYICGVIIAPHIMFLVGMAFLSRKDMEHRSFGLRLCRWSAIVLAAGSLAYYVYFAPFTGMD